MAKDFLQSQVVVAQSFVGIPLFLSQIHLCYSAFIFIPIDIWEGYPDIYLLGHLGNEYILSFFYTILYFVFTELLANLFYRKQIRKMNTKNSDSQYVKCERYSTLQKPSSTCNLQL